LVNEGSEIASWAETTYILSNRGVKTNVTLIFTEAQGLMEVLEQLLAK
jgi:transaldolase